MLRIRIELIPFGDEAMAKQIGEMVIANAGANGDGTFKYVGAFADDRGDREYGLVLSHDRNQSTLAILKAMSEEMLAGLDIKELKNLHLEEYMERLKKKLTVKE